MKLQISRWPKCRIWWRGRIIGFASLPSLREVFADVWREENCHSVMLMKKGARASIENSALVLVDANASKTFNNQHRAEDKPRIWCDFCNKPHHIRETCWKILGKPTNWKSSKPEIDLLVQMRMMLVPSVKSKCIIFWSCWNPIHSLVFLMFLWLKQVATLVLSLVILVLHLGFLIQVLLITWKISLMYLILIHLVLVIKKVRIANGKFSFIAGKGYIKIFEKITLKSILHVPKLACNLLSVSQLSKDSNCRVTFFWFSLWILGLEHEDDDW